VSRGYFALVLHSHLPYVRHPEHAYFLEEQWFFEAMTETYIPFLHAFEAMRRDNVDFRLTLSISATRCSWSATPRSSTARSNSETARSTAPGTTGL